MSSLLDSLAEQFLCPILKAPFIDPVVADDGHTYERKAIQNWLKTSKKSPMTNLQLQSITLRPNHTLKSLKKKIYQLLPPQTQKFDIIQAQNYQLQQQIHRLQKQLGYFKEKYQQSQQITKKHLKLTKIEQKMVNQHTKSLEMEKQQKQRLHKQIRETNKKMSQMKRQFQEQRERVDKESQKLSKQIKKLQRQLQKKDQIYKRANQEMSQCVVSLVKIVTTMMYHVSSMRSEIGQEASQNCFQDLQQRIIKSLKPMTPQTNDYYKMYSRIIPFISTTKLSRDILLIYPSLIVKTEQDYFQIHLVMNIKDILKMESNKSQSQQHQSTTAYFKDNIEGIIVQLQSQSDHKKWKQFLKISKQYENISSIKIYHNEHARFISKQDLEQFENLNYVHYEEEFLNQSSKREIEQFKRENSDIIFNGDLYDKKVCECGNDDDQESQEGGDEQHQELQQQERQQASQIRQE